MSSGQVVGIVPVESKFAAFWLANKRWIYPSIMFVVALLGGNADRVGEFIPTSPDVNKVEAQVKELGEKVDKFGNQLEVVARVVAAHEAKLFPAEPTPEHNGKPLFRE